MNKMENKTKIEEHEVNSSLRLLVKTSVIVFVGVVLSKVFTYLYRIIVARAYGAEVYGLLSLAMVVSGWFIAISAFGLNEGLARYIPLYRGKKEQAKINFIFRLILNILTLSSVLAGIIMFFTSSLIAEEVFHNSSLTYFLKVFSIVVPVSVISSVLLSGLRAFEKIGVYSLIFNIVQTSAKLALLGFFVWIGLEQNAVPWSYLLGLTIMLIASYIACKKYLPLIFIKSKLPRKERREITKEILSYSLPVLLYGVIAGMFYWIDSAFIGFYKDAYAVGIYNAAVPIALLLGFFPEMFMQLFFPMITREYAKHRIEMIRDLSKQMFKWIFAFNLPLAVIIFLFPGAALNILFGQEYLAAENALRILVIGSLFMSFTVVSSQLLSMLGKSRIILANTLFVTFLNIVLNWWLVPLPEIFSLNNANGGVGAAFGTIISMMVLGSLSAIEVYYFSRIVPLRRKLAVVGISAIIASTLLIYVKQMFELNLMVIALLIAMFGIVYFALLVLFRAFDRYDLGIIKFFWNKLSSVSE